MHRQNKFGDQMVEIGGSGDSSSAVSDEMTEAEAENLLRSELQPSHAPGGNAEAVAGSHSAPHPPQSAAPHAAEHVHPGDTMALPGVSTRPVGGDRMCICVICLVEMTQLTKGVMIFTCQRRECATTTPHCKDCHIIHLKKITKKVVCPACRLPSSVKAVDEWHRPDDRGGSHLTSEKSSSPQAHFSSVTAEFFEHSKQVMQVAEIEQSEQRERAASRTGADGALGKQLMEEAAKLQPAYDAKHASDEEASQQKIQEMRQNEGWGAAGHGDVGGEGSGRPNGGSSSLESAS